MAASSAGRHKYSVQRLAMWVLWTQFDGKRVYTEREVNEVSSSGITPGATTSRCAAS